MVPFVLPWNDATTNLVDYSGANPPIDAASRVSVDSEGHFAVQGRRIRFLGVNFAGDSPFMPTNKAEAVAARLAKFGVNNVRFHHMDAPWATGGGILAYTSMSSRNFNAAQLERLHFLVSRLKAHGVYANLNLLVGREYRSGDGLGSEITALDWKDQHILGFFNDTALAIQKEYATRLLTPTNRFTGLPLAQDPAVALVEIINENGLVQKWYEGVLDGLPARYAGQLEARWNDWLVRRYTNDPAMLAAWKAIDTPLGTNLLKNGAFANGLANWNQEQHDTARATFTRTYEFTNHPSARIQTTTAGSASWHIQFNQAGLGLVAGRAYTFSFWARADRAASLDAAVMRAYGDYGVTGYSERLSLTTNWQFCTATFQSPVTDSNIRVNFGGLGTQLATVWLADVRFQAGGRIGTLPAGASLAARSVPSIRHGGPGFTGTLDARRDWLRFARDCECGYYDDMVGHLRTNVGYVGLVFGTIMANSPATVQSRLDVIDGHAYWQHPQFPGTPWDSVNWTVENVSLVNTLGDANPLAGLARQRIQGKPFTVTEYQHPAPNQYGAEGPLLLAAYAALQDWDGLWLFDYGPGNDSVTMGRIRGFFDTAQHPTRMANLRLAAHLFRRGDIRPAAREYTLALKPDDEIERLLEDGRSWSVFSGAQLGLPDRLPLVGRVSTSVGPDATGLATPPANPTANLLQSDTAELRWDLRTAGRGVFTADCPRTKIVVGFAANRVFDLGGVVVRPGTNLLGWLTFGLTLVQGDSFTNGGTALLVAAGQCENTGMKWKDSQKNSVGNQWGSAPTLVEVVPLTVTLPVGTNRVQAWTLDERGRRRSPLSPAGDGLATTLALTTNTATLWYEIQIEPPISGYALWQAQNFTPSELADPAVSGDLADPAGDGVPNLFKYAFALPAASPAPPEALPAPRLWPESGEQYLALTYRRGVAIDDLAFRFETASGLSGWQGGEEASRVVAIEDLGAAQRVTVRDVAPIRTAPGRFLRFRIERSGPEACARPDRVPR